MPAYKDDKTGKWFAKFRTKDWKGETKHVTKRGFDTRREALAYEREYLVTQHGAPDMTFAEYATLYKKDIAPRIKESTFETKKSIIDKRLIPYFGNKKLSSINSTDVLNWQNELINCNGTRDGTPFTKSYLKTIHNQLSAMLNHAVKYYGLPNNYARLVGNMGHEKDVKTDFWTLEEYECFSKSIIDFPEAFYAFEILYWCGIREGELLALTFSDFDFQTNMLSVNKTYHRMHGEDIITSPKTPKSVRKVALPLRLAEKLKVYFSMIYDTSPDARVFSVTKSFLHRVMNIGSKAADVKKIRIHDLRHSHVSLLISMGYSAVAIADRMGHESSDITYRYAHLFPSIQTDMASKLDDLRGDA